MWAIYVRESTIQINLTYVRPLNAQHGIQHLTLDHKHLTLDNQHFWNKVSSLEILMFSQCRPSPPP